CRHSRRAARRLQPAPGVLSVSCLSVLPAGFRVDPFRQLQLLFRLAEMYPVTDQAVGYRQQYRAKKYPHEAEGYDATKYAHQYHNQWQVAAAADQVGFEEVVNAADHHKAPEQHE